MGLEFLNVHKDNITGTSVVYHVTLNGFKIDVAINFVLPHLNLNQEILVRNFDITWLSHGCHKTFSEVHFKISKFSIS